MPIKRKPRKPSKPSKPRKPSKPTKKYSNFFEAKAAIKRGAKK